MDEGQADDREEHDEAGAGGIDSHMWLNPADMPALVAAIGEQHTVCDPTSADSYRANASALADELGLQAGALSTITSVEDGEDYFTVARAVPCQAHVRGRRAERGSPRSRLAARRECEDS